MGYNPDNPLIIQSDGAALLDVHNPHFDKARNALCSFAELVKSPEHIHTYQITPLSIWNARTLGIETSQILRQLEDLSKYDIPANITHEIREYARKYGRISLAREGKELVLAFDEPELLTELARLKEMKPFLGNRRTPTQAVIGLTDRGAVKQALIKIGYPVEDRAGYLPGESLEIDVRAQTRSGRKFSLRDYQKQAVDAFHAGGSNRGGSGVVVLPCGAGKTIVGIAAIVRLGYESLILVTNITAARQWKRELLDKTTLSEESVGEYSGDRKEIRPVTIVTYQILTYHRDGGDFPHFRIFDAKNWGLIVYDEVHLLPAPVFRITSGLQAKRRLGLTATLIREDGLETDVFSLIGPKKYDVPWRELERDNWIAKGICTEVRVELPREIRMTYAVAPRRRKFRLASENSEKNKIIARLVSLHANDGILVIGQYIAQLNKIAKEIKAPIITGKTPNQEREELFDSFRKSDIPVLVVSKVANFAVDLPEAGVAIQVSGMYGSRQEEAQRLGRILRPKKHNAEAHFYSLVTRGTVEQDFAMKRQLFLTEQGYQYSIVSAEQLLDGGDSA